jgi:hypothetical protein
VTRSSNAREKVQRWLLNPIKWIFVIIGGIWTIVQISSFFSTSLSLEPQSEVDPSVSASTVFYLSNDGVLPIHEVEGGCIWHEVADIDDNYMANIGATAEGLPHMRPLSAPVEAKRQVTVGCADPLTGDIPLPGKAQSAVHAAPFHYADLSIYLSYRPAHGLWRNAEEFHFIGVRNADGNLEWHSASASDSKTTEALEQS